MPHNIPMVMLGTFILAFGWFGFNPGSTLAGTDLRIAVVAVNTMIAGSTGRRSATTLYMWWFKTKKPDPSMMCNGLLAGLVAITAPCAFVSAGGAGDHRHRRRPSGGRGRVLLRQRSASTMRRHHLGPRRQRRLGLPFDRPLRRRHLRRRLERRVRHGDRSRLLRRRHGPVLGRADRRHDLLHHRCRFCRSSSTSLPRNS
jgi:hypothetical protein